MSFGSIIQSGGGLSYPTVRPKFDLNLIRNRSIPPEYTFTRNSSGTYVGADGLIKTAAIGEPRFEFDPVTGEFKGLLVEESRTNFLQGSNSLTGNRWVVDNTIITLEGSNARGNFYRLRGTNGGYNGLVSNFNVWGVFPGLSTRVTLSMDAKVPDNETGSRLIQFTIIATFGSTGAFIDSTFTTVSNTSTLGIDLGNGWRRYFATYTWMSSTSGTPFVKINPRFLTSQNVLIANLQLERGDTMTSYIPTTTATVTRQPDQLVLNRTLNPQGAFYIESNNTLGTSLVADNGTSTISPPQGTKSALFYNTSRTLFMSSSTTPVEGNFNVTQNLNRVSLGFDRLNNSSYINGHLKKFMYYGSPVTEDNLRSLTGNTRSTFRFGLEQIITDVDVLSYISRIYLVESVPLEPNVILAINNFVVGCKADGIWNAIKASCILAGARTLAGALVPLVGAAPTNFNFVSGDYNRKTGLVGNGSTKYLNSNRIASADPAGNRHLSVYLSALGAQTARSYAGVTPPATTLLIGGLALVEYTIDGSILYVGSRNSIGLAAVQAISSTTYQALAEGNIATGTKASIAPGPSIPYYIYGENNANTATRFSNARLAFYSIGESLNLALLNARVTTLINAFAAAIP
jgi:hypothetical protein